MKGQMVRNLKESFNTGIKKLFNSPYLYIAPALILIITFTILPVCYAAYNSLFKWDIVLDVKTFVGVSNFKSILTNTDFYLILKNTLIYTIFSVFFGLIFSVLLGVFLNDNRKSSDIVQSIIFTPQIISFVSISILWMWLLDPQMGIVNYVLESVGLEPKLWMMSPETSLLSILMVSIWKGIGYSTLMVVAGLQGIPQSIYEASKLDRASKFTTLIKITIPLLSPTLFFMFITSIIGSFCAFDVVNLMTQGGPNNSSNLLVHWIWQEGFQYLRVGEAMAASILLFVIVSIISLINYLVGSKKVHY